MKSKVYAKKPTTLVLQKEVQCCFNQTLKKLIHLKPFLQISELPTTLPLSIQILKHKSSENIPLNLNAAKPKKKE